MGFPILGDPQYATEASLARSEIMGLTGQRLCAHSLQFRHPMTQELLTVKTQLECEI
jgi:23S rRNA-/tRNA-specific pseudouridylate synthase